jgi:hypothetical protein
MSASSIRVNFGFHWSFFRGPPVVRNAVANLAKWESMVVAETPESQWSQNGGGEFIAG